MIEIFGASHLGLVRQRNEDALFIDAQRALAVIADGMGGHSDGEIASQMVIDSFTKNTNTTIDLKETLLKAHAAIIAHTQTQPESYSIGATVAAVQADALSYRIAWAGDSRIYRWQIDGGLKQLTKDHSYLEALISAGKITVAQARNHPQRHVVTQSLGIKEPRIDINRGNWSTGDRILLCSDGLTDELEDQHIDSILGENSDLPTATASLIETALANGGRDNITIILMENSRLK